MVGVLVEGHHEVPERFELLETAGSSLKEVNHARPIGNISLYSLLRVLGLEQSFTIVNVPANRYSLHLLPVAGVQNSVLMQLAKVETFPYGFLDEKSLNKKTD